MNFENKVVLITGAGSGIGEAVAGHFARLSAKLSLLDIDKVNLGRVAEKCEKLKAQVLAVEVDITHERDIKEAVEKTVQKYGKIDVLVNSAGIFRKGGILDTDLLTIFDKIIQVNLRSTVAMTHYVAPFLIESKGCVVNIASMSAKLVNKYSVCYNVSKAGVVHFTKNVALELADKGVRVNCILPGPVKTRILIHAGLSEEENEKYSEGITKSVPLQRHTDPEEIADMVVYLASEKSRSITGAEFTIDAGYTIAGQSSIVTPYTETPQ